jgi:hypothetical protein
MTEELRPDDPSSVRLALPSSSDVLSCSSAARRVTISRLWFASWSLPVHRPHPLCSCLRCAWRAKHSTFWESLELCLQSTSSNMSIGSDTEGSGDDFPIDFAASADYVIVDETPLQFLPRIRSNPLLLPTAREQADFILNSAQVSAARHDARRRSSNMVHGHLAALYPHLERYFDGADLDACARIDWMRCSGEDLWNVLTSKHLACGKAANASMSLSFRDALKKLKDITLDESLKARFEQALSITNDKHPSHASLRAYFVSALQNSSILNSVCAAMATYHRGKKIHIKDNGLFPKFTEVQCNMVRVALFMASASAQPICGTVPPPYSKMHLTQTSLVVE